MTTDLAPGFFDRIEALSFLGALVEDIKTPLSWRAFSDTVRGAKAYTWYGSFDSVSDQLVDAQRKGYGIFLVINATAPNGHDDASVLSPRAAYVDGDGLPMPETWALPPTLLTARDATHWHAYWMLEEGEPIARFRAVQKRLIAYYGTDPQIVNESRVMRVPGFLHFKNPLNPQMYRVIKHSPAALYTIEQVAAAHPDGTGAAATPKAPSEAPAAQLATAGLTIPSGRRNNALASLAGHLRALGLSDEAMDAALQKVNRERCVPPMAPDEVRAVARSIARYEFDPVVAATAAGAEPPKVAPSMLVPRYHADRLANRLSPPPDLVDGCLPVGGLAAFIALPGVGKTLMSLELARCIASGEPFAGRATQRGKVIYLCPDAPASTERRMLAMPAEVHANIVSVVTMPKRLPADIEGLRLLIEHENDNDPNNRVLLVVVDTWDAARSHAGGGYADQDAMAEGVLAELRTIVEAYRCSACIVHHSTKADTGSARGTLVFEARLEWKASVEAAGETVLLTTTKNRDGERGHVGSWRIKPVVIGEKAVPVLVPQDEKGTRDASADARDARILRAIIGLADAGEKLTNRSVAAAAGVNWGNSLLRALERLREAGHLSRKGLSPTDSGRAFADQEPGLTACSASLAEPGGGSGSEPGFTAAGSKTVSRVPVDVNPGSTDSAAPPARTHTPFYKKGGGVQADVSRSDRLTSKPSDAEDVFGSIDDDDDPDPHGNGRKRGSL